MQWWQRSFPPANIVTSFQSFSKSTFCVGFKRNIKVSHCLNQTWRELSCIWGRLTLSSLMAVIRACTCAGMSLYGTNPSRRRWDMTTSGFRGSTHQEEPKTRVHLRGLSSGCSHVEALLFGQTLVGREALQGGVELPQDVWGERSNILLWNNLSESYLNVNGFMKLSFGKPEQTCLCTVHRLLGEILPRLMFH